MKPTPKIILYRIIDIIDRLKQRDSMIPPKSLTSVGRGDFQQIGQEFKKYFIDLANLQPTNRVLDVGCGIGSMTIPLTSFLSPEGECWGFDIVPKGIDWCQRRISSKYSNFHFIHCNVYNRRYNRKGKILSENYQFPFDNESFDFVFLTSVFTHMLPPALENYLSEISRVLKAGGKCLITYFLLNKESENLIDAGHSVIDFRYKIDGCLTKNENIPESGIAHNEEFVKKLYEKYRLKIIQPIHYGSWCKRDTFLSSQDIIVATKEIQN